MLKKNQTKTGRMTILTQRKGKNIPTERIPMTQDSHLRKVRREYPTLAAAMAIAPISTVARRIIKSIIA